MSKKKLNKGLQERQEVLRQKTIKSVEEAIKDLKEEGFEVSTKLLIERTGLSRPVFSKVHVLEVLKKHSVCRYKNIKQVSQDSDKSYVKALEKQVNELSRELEKAQKNLDLFVKRNVKLELEVQDLKDTNELLRGQLKLNYDKALLHGVDLE